MRSAPAGGRRKQARPTHDARATPPQVPEAVPIIVGLGSSAGGLDALKRFFGAMPADTGIAFVVVAHLDPTHPSLMAEIIGRATAMPVIQLDADTPIERNRVYCIAPGRHLSVSGRTLRLRLPAETGSVRMPIDSFLRSLAEVAPGRAVGIVLSGTGSDGTIGLRHIKAAGGLTLVQDPASAEHDGMPRSAIDAGVVDHVLPPDGMPAILLAYARRSHRCDVAGSARPSTIEPGELNDLLHVLHARTQFDFRSYKRSTLERRIGRRMALKHVDRIADYARVLTDDVAEATALFDDLLISVTGFFRDPEAWNVLQEQVIRPLVARTDGRRTLRVWVPGCATGEEAYTVAMLLIEALPTGQSGTVQVFASDVDADAIELARAGLYPARIAEDVSPERLRRFFVEDDRGYRVTKALRDTVVFARQNVAVDPPFPALDLVSCRNLLMYFEAGVQQHVLSLLHFALADDGHLFLGTAETVGREEDLFAVVSRKWRIYRRIGPTRHDRVQLPRTSASVPRTPARRPSPPRPDVGRLAAISLQALVERFVPASVLIDRKGAIVYLAGPTQDYLRQPSGVPTLDLMTRIRAGLEAGIRGAVRKAQRDGRRTVVRGARVRRGDAWHRVEVTAEPLGGAPELQGLLLLSFADEPPATEPVAARSGSVPEHDEPILRQLEDELETVREDLQGSLQDLQGSNQELRVANEEVMSVNEEMRSSNEELETSKEELQSLNEELITVNATLNERVVELQQAHNDLDNLLTSSNIATVILDTTFHVRRFTPAATRLFALTTADVGRPIGSVRARANDPALLRDAAAVLANLRPISAEVQGDDGWWFVRQVQPYRTRDNRIEGVVITFSDVAAEALQEARLYAEAIVDTVREPLIVLDSTLIVQSANRSFYQTFHVTPETTVGLPVHELGNRQLDVPRLRTLLGEVLRERSAVSNFEVSHDFPELGRRNLLLNARTLARGGGRPDLILLAIEDVTDRKRAERTVRESAAMTRAGVETAIDGVITLDESATILSFNPAAERIYGMASAEMIGQSFADLDVPTDGDHAGELSRYLCTGAREGRGRRRDGTPFPCDLHVSEFDEGGARRFVVTIRDITERKRSEAQIRRQQGEMAHVLRVATIERFAAELAHELNQPLAAIANDLEACATYVRAGKTSPRRLLGLLDRAGAEALRAGAIVGHLRAFVQRAEPRFESTDVSELARAATRWLSHEIEHERITLHLDLDAQRLPVRVDRIQIEQVLVNLLQNAVDAIREADVTTRDIWLRTSRSADGTAEVAVDDTGAGVTAAAADRLYEPFFTTKPDGMGMGLAICLTIAEMHQGRIAVEPRAGGQGTSARLVLPLEGSA